MNEQQQRRVQKLMKVNMKSEHPPDLVIKLVNDSIMLDSRINGMSDKEVIDVLIAKDDHESKSIGVMYHILTCGDNQELFLRMIRYINGGGVDYWHTILCNMNMALFELWPFIHWNCKEQLMRLIREGVRQNVKQIENVVMSGFRSILSSSDFATKTRSLNYLTSIIREFEVWFKTQKQLSGLVASIFTSISHAIVSSPAPLTKEDVFRENMTNFVAWVIKVRKSDCVAMGRDFVAVLIKLGKMPQIEDIWKDIVANPGSYSVSGVDEYLGKPNMLQQLRLSCELQRRLDFMVHHGGKNMLTYFAWLSNKFLRFNDGHGMRAECVRYLVNGVMLDPSKVPPVVYENRVQLLHLLVATTPSGPDQQWMKMCLFIDWFGCDDRIPMNLNGIDVPLNVVKYALFLQAPPPHQNSFIQASHCSQFANSLLEYLCKSVDVIIPAYSEQVRRNVNNAMRFCRDRLQHGLTQILEHHKIDRRVGELLRNVFPEFVRNNAVIKMKKKTAPPPMEEKRVTSAPSTSSQSQESSSDENSVSTPTVVVAEKTVRADREKQKKEREEREENELTSSMKLMKDGEIKTKLENLRTQWKEFNDDADKCEAVEVVINAMLNTEENFDDAQQEIAAQCLLGIIGSVVVEEKSLLPDNEKDLSEAFTHPIYSFLKILCNPPDDDDSSSEMMTNLMAAMREKDSTLTYVFLYFIKGTGSRSSECIESYKDVAKISYGNVDEMLASDLQMCAVKDNRLFAYLVPFVFTQFEEYVMQSPELLQTLCANLDALQLRNFVSDIIREEITLFKKETFTRMVMASVEWATTPQWVFWHLVHAGGVHIEWFVSIITKLDASKHDEAIANILLMMKRMDREPWAALIRQIFSRLPTKNDNFTADALKVLIEDSEQCQKVAELVGQLIKKLLGNNDILGVGVRLPKKGTPLKLTLQQVLEHLQWFTTTYVQKKERATEAFMARSHMQEAFSAIKANDKASVLLKKYSNLFGAMDIIAQDSKEPSRTLRGNRQGSGNEKQQQQQKRKANENDDEQNNKKRKVHKEIIELSDSDSD